MADEKPGMWQSLKNLMTGQTEWQQKAGAALSGPEAMASGQEAGKQLLQGHFSEAMKLAIQSEKQYLHHVKNFISADEISAPSSAKAPPKAAAGKAAGKPGGPPAAPTLN